MKKLLKEIAIIIFTATFIAIVYNIFSSEPLPWIYKTIEPALVHDTELVIKHTERNDTSSIATVIETETPDTMKTKILNKIDTTAEIRTPEVTAETKIDAAKSKIEEEQKTNPGDEPKLKTLNYDQVTANLDNPDFLFIDARPKQEWEEDRIGNAIHIAPPYDGNVNDYFQSLMSLPQDKILVVYCSGGTCEASHKVAADLKSLGYKKVFLYAGGWDDWTKRRGE